MIFIFNHQVFKVKNTISKKYSRFTQNYQKINIYFMKILSIIACDMLEDELTYVLSKDNSLEQLILVEKKECFGLQRKLKSLGCLPALVPLDRIPEILKNEKNQSFPALLKPLCSLHFIEKIQLKLENMHKNKVTVVANMLKMGLHIDNELLKAEVYRNIREMSRFSDRILIFYGTCGHSLVNIEKDFEDLECQLYFLRDDNGEIVEDCISVALGGNDAYARAMVSSEGEGTFYLTPMWASGWQDFPKEKFQELSEHDKNISEGTEELRRSIPRFRMSRILTKMSGILRGFLI